MKTINLIISAGAAFLILLFYLSGCSNEQNLTNKESKSEPLSLQDIGESEWILKSWKYQDEMPKDLEITLILKDGKFVGMSGCNRYFTPVSSGELPGEITTGLAGSTMMACPDSFMTIEKHFLNYLSGIKKFGFIDTKLVLTYESDDDNGTLIFEKNQS